jgi:hypothetical protein
MRTKWLVALCTIAPLAGCATPAATTAATTVNAQTVTMQQQLQTWGANGPKTYMIQFGQLTQDIARSIDIDDYDTVSHDCAQLLDIIQSAQQLPPAPDQIIQNYWSTSLADYAKSAQECQDSITAYGADNQLMQQAANDLTNGNAEFEQMTQRMVAFNNGTAIAVN